MGSGGSEAIWWRAALAAAMRMSRGVDEGPRWGKSGGRAWLMASIGRGCPWNFISPERVRTASPAEKVLEWGLANSSRW